jgi:hypothetical protein
VNRQTVLTRKLPFTREVPLERVKIESTTSPYPSTMSHTKRDRVEECQADFVLEIDYDGLVRSLFNRAARSKGRKAQLASGLIRLVKRNEKIVRAQEREYPVREGWKEVA